MIADPHVAMIAAITIGVGYMMTVSGLQKSALELKRRRRTCPSCGRYIEARSCACTS